MYIPIFFVSGFIAVVCQTLLIREMLVVFSGNELTIGILLSNWLLGSALGSFAGPRFLAEQELKPKTPLLLSFIILAAILYFEFVFTRNIRAAFNLFPGSAPSLPLIFYASAIALLPISFISGIQFSLGIKLLEEENKPLFFSSVYIWESLGYLFGGIIFTFVFITYLNSSTIIFSAVFLCLVITIKYVQNKLLRTAAVVLALMLAFGMPFISNKMEKSTLNNLYKGFVVEEITNSHYGQVAVLSKGFEKFVCLDGVVLKIIPDTDTAAQEEFAILPYLFSNPENILIIGGARKYISVLATLGQAKIDHLEWDPVILDSIAKHQKTISYTNVTQYCGEPRELLKKSGRKYDLVLICVPFPVTLSQTRFYTFEFYKLLREKMSDKGVLALNLPGSAAYISSPLGGIIGTVNKTLTDVFTNVKMIPGDGILVLASQNEFKTKEEAVSILEKLNGKLSFISRQYLDYRLDNAREKWLNNSFSGNTYITNSDFHPILLSCGLEYWQSMFSNRSKMFYSAIKKYSWLLWLLPLLFLLPKRIGSGSTAFSTGFFAMGQQIIFIFLLEILKGGMYHWLGLLSAIFMAGIALGCFTDNKLAKLSIRTVESSMTLWCLLLYTLVQFRLINWTMLFVFSLVTGIFLGMEFAVLTAYEKEKMRTNEGNSAINIYVFDIVGGWSAAIITSTFLIPLWGIQKVLLFFILIKTITAGRWLYNRDNGISVQKPVLGN